MGGLIILSSIVITSLFYMKDYPRIIPVLFMTVGFGIIGFLDDYMKVKKKENTGLTAGPKFLLQLAAAIVFTILLRNEGYLSPDLYIPFVNVTFQLPWVVYMVFAAFVMVGTSTPPEYHGRNRRPVQQCHRAGGHVLHHCGGPVGPRGDRCGLRRSGGRTAGLPDL